MIAVKNTDLKRKNHRPWRGAMERFLDLVKRQRGFGKHQKWTRALWFTKEKEVPRKRLGIPGLSNFRGV